MTTARPSRLRDGIRDIAVARVDARHGYTIEFSHSQHAHAAEYDEEEKRVEAEFAADPGLAICPADHPHRIHPLGAGMFVCFECWARLVTGARPRAQGGA